MLNSLFLKAAASLALAGLAVSPAAAQDAGTSWDASAQAEVPVEAETQVQSEPAPQQNDWFPTEEQAEEARPADPAPAATPPGSAAAPDGSRIPRRDIFDAAENVFGRGAEGLAGILERIFAEQGEPVAYISGEEASGAIGFGIRYGSGVMRHTIEGDRDVYWTGPSIGFDVGAQASKVFVLVYNLHDAQRIYRRYAAAEGNAYFVGGFTASYLRRGDVVLIPVRLGVGMRLGVNAGYMRFSERNRWVPF